MIATNPCREILLGTHETNMINKTIEDYFNKTIEDYSDWDRDIKFPVGVLIACNGGIHGYTDWIHWDLNIKAPVTHFMSSGESIEYMSKNNYVSCLLNGTKPLCWPPNQQLPIVARDIDKTMFDSIIHNNHAGPNGESINWQEIRYYYDIIGKQNQK